MKSVLVSSLLFLFAISSATAQENPSPEAEAFFNKAMSEINANHVRTIKGFGLKMHVRNFPDRSAKKMATDYVRLVKLNNNDIEAIAFLILMEASKSAQEDLKAIMAGVKSINNQKKEQRELLAKMQRQKSMTSEQLDSFKLSRSKTVAIQKKQNPDTVRLVRSVAFKKSPTKTEINAMVDQIKKDLDSMNEMSELDQLRLQMLMDRRSKMMETLSNLMKKFSDTQEDIIQNLK